MYPHFGHGAYFDANAAPHWPQWPLAPPAGWGLYVVLVCPQFGHGEYFDANGVPHWPQNPLPPSSYTNVSGKFELGSVSVLMAAFGGGTPDKKDFSVNVKLEKRILGFIPFMYERNYSMDEFIENFGP